MKKLCVLLSTIFLLLTGCSGAATSEHVYRHSSDSTINQSSQSTPIDAKIIHLALQSQEVDIRFISVEECSDLVALSKQTDKWSFVREKIEIINSDGNLNSQLLNGGTAPTALILVTQSYENTSNEEIQLSLLSNKLGGLDPITHQAIEELTGPRYYSAVYLSIEGEGQQIGGEKGFWLVNLPSGKKTEITIGYVVPKTLLDKEIQYTFSPFGDTDQESGVGYTRFIL